MEKQITVSSRQAMTNHIAKVAVDLVKEGVGVELSISSVERRIKQRIIAISEGWFNGGLAMCFTSGGKWYSIELISALAHQGNVVVRVMVAPREGDSVLIEELIEFVTIGDEF